MMALNVCSFYAVLILHSATFRDPGTPSTIMILLSCALSWNVQSFVFNSKVAYYCLYVIFVVNSIRGGGSDAIENYRQSDVNIAMSRASQNQSCGFRAYFYVSWPMYLWFLVGPIAAILLLSPLIIRSLWLHFIGTQRHSNTMMIPSGSILEVRIDH